MMGQDICPPEIHRSASTMDTTSQQNFTHSTDQFDEEITQFLTFDSLQPIPRIVAQPINFIQQNEHDLASTMLFDLPA